MSTVYPSNYYNHADDKSDSAAKRERLLFVDGRYLQGAELNEMQSMTQKRITGIGDALFSDGDVISDGQISVNSSTGAVSAQAGKVYLSGAVREVPAANFTIPVKGTVAIGIRMTTSSVSETDDKTLYNPAVGTRSEGEPGAWREVVNLSWGYSEDGGEGDFYAIYTVDDGVVRATETPPDLSSVSQAIAAYDVQSTGGGTYAVSGLQLHALDDEAGKQVYTVDAGKARVSGKSIELSTSRRIVYAAEPDLRTIDTEITLADGSASQRVDLAHTPVDDITSVRITMKKTETVVHGSYTGCADALSETSVVEILSVAQGDTTYTAGSDYKKTGDTVDWSPSGEEPSSGTSYSVTYTYIAAAEPEDMDADGYTVSGAVKGTSIMTTYHQALPRYDRLCLSSDGTFTWIAGVGSETNRQKPNVPDGVLLLATVDQTWRTGTRTISQDGTRVVSMSDMEALEARVDYALNQVSLNRLESDVATREAGIKAGLFVDPLLDDSMRDQGLEQTGAVVNQCLLLPVSATVHELDGPSIPKGRAYTNVTALEQPLRTGSMQVNPYLAFAPVPAEVSLVPSVDNWTETKSVWTSPITKTFNSAVYAPNGIWGYAHGSTVTKTQTSTLVSGETTSQIAYLRQTKITFTVSGFEANEALKSLTFDGIDVTPVGVTADKDGTFTGSFTIPQGVPAGAKTVAFTGGNGSYGEAVFTGQGSLTVQTLRTLRTVTNILIDPLAQTFILDADTQCTGADLWFTACGGDATIEIRETSNGVPTKTVLARGKVKKASVIVSGGGYTRITFDAPVLLSAGVEYALVVLADEAVTSVSIAETGKYDSTHGQWVISQPYTVGVLLSSSNASTWTAHQDKDLAFRILKADYAAAGSSEIDLGSADVTGATDLIFLCVSEIPNSACSVDYVLTLPDASQIHVDAGQTVKLPAAITGTVSAKAVLTGTADMSPLIWPGAELAEGIVSETGNYYSRSIPATDAAKCTVVYDAYVPSGSTVVPTIQKDSGSWETLTAGATTKMDDGWVEFVWTANISKIAALKLKLELTGTSAARPMAANIRFMATV